VYENGGVVVVAFVCNGVGHWGGFAEEYGGVIRLICSAFEENDRRSLGERVL
jgi:hypothetical protein